MMTKKHYIEAAKIVKATWQAAEKSSVSSNVLDLQQVTRLTLISAFVAFFRKDGNPQFDADRFRAACEEA